MTSSTMMRSFFAAILAAVVAATFLIVPAPKAQAWSNGACTSSNGVTVVVDFAGLGGGTVVRCAPGPQSSGISALRNAGFQVAFVQRNMSQGLFVCRIGDKPTPSSESCASTPPANASWSYWNANRGGSWRYSTAGAGNRRPATGSVEGWRFSSGRTAAPAVSPPAALKPAKKKPTKKKPAKKRPAKKKPTKKPAKKKPAKSAAAKKKAAHKAKAKAKKNAQQAKSQTKRAAAFTAGAAGAVGGSGVVTESITEPDTGGPVGLVVTVSLIGLIGAGTVILMRRRSRDS